MDCENVGAHCAHCGQRDFLPLVCDGCGKPFCSTHSTRESHSCTSVEGKRRLSRNKSKNPLHQCKVVKCRNYEPIAMNCVRCGNHFCIAHRFPEDHNCFALRNMTAKPPSGPDDLCKRPIPLRPVRNPKRSSRATQSSKVFPGRSRKFRCCIT
jgi:predicted nucleic acid binding AN1-type Zn finger protein